MQFYPNKLMYSLSIVLFFVQLIGCMKACKAKWDLYWSILIPFCPADNHIDKNFIDTNTYRFDLIYIEICKAKIYNCNSLCILVISLCLAGLHINLIIIQFKNAIWNKKLLVLKLIQIYITTNLSLYFIHWLIIC